MELTTTTRDEAQPPATQNPMALMQMAIESGATDQLEKLMDLQERWQANEARKAFFEAMARFQNDCPEIPKDGVVRDKHGKLMYRFAKLETVLKTIKDVERANGFRHRWDQEELEAGGVRIICEVSHVAGHAERSCVTIPPTKGMNTNAAQDRGIIIKYGKRYSLLNAYGLEPDEQDNDGRLPGDNEPKTITEEQAAILKDMLQESGADESRMLAWVSELAESEITKTADIPAAWYGEVHKKLKSKLGRNA